MVVMMMSNDDRDDDNDDGSGSHHEGASKSNVTYVFPNLNRSIILSRYVVRFNSYTRTKTACKLLQK